MTTGSTLKIRNLICILSGLLFIFSGVAKLLPVSAFEFQLVRDGITSWDLTPFLSRSLIVFEILLGFNLLIKSNLRKLTIPAAILLLFFFSVYLSISLFRTGIQANCGCFGQILPMSTLSALIKNLVLLAGLCFSFFIKSEERFSLKAVFIPAGAIIALVLILFPIRHYNQPVAQTQVPAATYEQHSTTPRMDTEKLVTTAHIVKQASKSPSEKIVGKVVAVTVPSTAISMFHRFSEFSNGHAYPDAGLHIVALLSLDCEHCLHTATEIGSLQQKKRLPQVLILFLGDEGEVPEFLAKSKLTGLYKVLPPTDFFPLLQKNPPKIVLLLDGNIVKDWDESTFSITALSEEIEKMGPAIR